MARTGRAVIEGWGTGGPGCERAGEGQRRGRVQKRESAGPTGTTGRREQKSKEEGEKGGSRILTKRWGMSRRVVCSHGSSLSTAVQYAGQGKVTLLCVRVCARARLLTVSHTIVRTRVYIPHYTVILSL